MQSEMYATRDRNLMARVLIALGVAYLLIIAAVVGLACAVVDMSKDTGVENNVFVSKDGLQPLSTALLRLTDPLGDLHQATSPAEPAASETCDPALLTLDGSGASVVAREARTGPPSLESSMGDGRWAIVFGPRRTRRRATGPFIFGSWYCSTRRVH